MTTFHIYCDESCHLENDHHDVMVLGALVCPREHVRRVAVDLRDLKSRFGLKPAFELKWTKVSQAKVDYYRAALDYFFDHDFLRFRAVVVGNKSKLRHADFGQSHDDFYFKTYFQLLVFWIDDAHRYRIFLDIKDTRSWAKTLRLQEVIANSKYDFDRNVVTSMDLVRSEQVEQIQLADLLIGTVSYANRGLTSNAGKVELVEHVRRRTRRKLTWSTPLAERKLNIFVWQPREVGR